MSRWAARMDAVEVQAHNFFLMAGYKGDDAEMIDYDDRDNGDLEDIEVWAKKPVAPKAELAAPYGWSGDEARSDR